MAFVNSFVQYAVILILLAGLAVLGVFAGKKLRDRKEAKNAAFDADSDMAETDEQQFFKMNSSVWMLNMIK